MGKEFKFYAVSIALVLAMFVTASSPLFAALSDTKIEYSWKRLGAGTITPRFTATSLAGSPTIISQNESDDIGTGIASDVDSRVFAVGFTNSLNFGTTTNNSSGGNDVFVTRYGTKTPSSGGNSDGGGMDFSILNDSTLIDGMWTITYGSTGDDRGMGIAVDKSGTESVYIAGFTSGSLDSDGDTDYTNSNAGNYDLFMSKITAQTGSIPWTRLVGGTGDDRGYAIATDVGIDKNVYAAGETNSATFGQYGDTGSQVSNVADGGYDALVVKFNGDGDVDTNPPAAIWTRFLGSAGYDTARGIAVNSSEEVYVTGYTNGAFEGQTAIGGFDVFVMELDLNGFDGAWSVSNYIQGSQASGVATGDDRGTGIVAVEDEDGVTTADYVYVCGYTDSSSFNGQTSKGEYDAFVTKLQMSDGTHVWTELVGSTQNDKGLGLTVDSNTGKVYLVGTTEGNMDQDGASGGTSLTNSGSTDVFVAVLDTSDGTWGKTMVLGTVQQDVGNGIAVKPNSTMLYVTGFSNGTPSTLDFPNTRAGGADVLDWKLSGLDDIAVSSDGALRFSDQELNTTGTRTVTITNLSTTAITMGSIVTASPFSVDLTDSTITAGQAACSESFVLAASGGTCTALLKYTPTTNSFSTANIVFNITGTNTPTSLDLQVKGKPLGVTSAETDRATLLTPDTSTDICGIIQEFTWQAGSSGTDAQYWLYVGTKPGGRDVYSENQSTGTSVSVSIPSATNVYLTLWTRQGTVWRSKQYTYTCSSGPSASNVKATITAPVPVPTVDDMTSTSQIGTSTSTFKWTSGTNVTEYWLYLGTTQGASDIYTSPKATQSTQVTVQSIPIGGTGANAYTRIWSHFSNGSWEYHDYHYTQPDS